VRRSSPTAARPSIVRRTTCGGATRLAILSAFVEASVDGILFVRPAVYVATELGSAVLWPSLEAALAANTREFQDALRGSSETRRVLVA